MTEAIHSEPDLDTAVEAEAAGAPATDEVKPSAGHMLTEAREARGMSVVEVAAQLRLSVRQVEALEADDFGRLPGTTFLRGFIRNYAKLLQLDPGPLLDACPAAQPQPEVPPIAAPSKDIEFSALKAPRRLLRPLGGLSARFLAKYAIAGLVVLVVVPLGLYLALHGGPRPPVEGKSAEVAAVPLALPPAEQQPAAGPAAATPVSPATPVIAPPPALAGQQGLQPAAAPAVPLAPSGAVPAAEPVPAPAPKLESTPVAAAPAASAAKPEAAAAGRGRIKLVFKGQSWVEIRDKSGKVVFSQLNSPGTEQTISGTPPFSLVVGNARMVTVTYNDKPVDLGPHTPVDVARLNLE